MLLLLLEVLQLQSLELRNVQILVSSLLSQSVDFCLDLLLLLGLLLEFKNQWMVRLHILIGSLDLLHLHILGIRLLIIFFNQSSEGNLFSLVPSEAIVIIQSRPVEVFIQFGCHLRQRLRSEDMGDRHIWVLNLTQHQS